MIRIIISLLMTVIFLFLLGWYAVEQTRDSVMKRECLSAGGRMVNGECQGRWLR